MTEMMPTELAVARRPGRPRKYHSPEEIAAAYIANLQKANEANRANPAVCLERARRYREENRLMLAQKARERRARTKAEIAPPEEAQR